MTTNTLPSFLSKNIILVLGGLFFIISAIFSEGYFHADEHYQIVEFAEYFIGNNTANNLAWEFEAQIRPSLQPILAAVIISTSRFIGVESNHSISFILRLISGAFAFFAYYQFHKSLKKEHKIQLNAYTFFFIFMLWFIPFLSVRFSSENWGALFLLLGIGKIINSENKKQFIVAGVYFGVSFLFRFQMALAILGVLGWYISQRQKPLSNLWQIGLGGFSILVIGVFLDTWLYDEFTISFWNYFKSNLIEGKASSFGTQPWYSYATWVFRYSFFPIGIVILISTLIFTIKRPRHVITWALVPFILAHCIIGHKELRFLFPLIPFLPYLFMDLYGRIKSSRFRSAKKISILILLTLNALLLVTSSIIPVGLTARTKVTRYLEAHSKKSPDQLSIYYISENPIRPWGLQTPFFDHHTTVQRHIQAVDQLPQDGPYYVVLTLKESTHNKKWLLSHGFNRELTSVPNYLIFPITKIYSARERSILTVWKK